MGFVTTRLVAAVVVMGALTIPLPAQASDSLLFGEEHAYTVTLRGNGEAVVLAKLTFTNHDPLPITSYSFSVVGATPSEMSGYQQLLAPPSCQYEVNGKPLSSSTGLAPTLALLPCSPLAAPDYLTYNSSYNPASLTSNYASLKLDDQGSNRYVIKLPKPVAENDSTTLLISYAARGYVSAQLGRFNYKFQTLKVPGRVANVTVAVAVDSDLYLNDAQSHVNYAGTSLSSGASTASPALATGSASKTLDSIATSIGATGQLVKTAKDLSAGETYSVKGVYADADWKLHLGQLAILITIGLGVLILLVWAVISSRRRVTTKLPTPATVPPSPPSSTNLDLFGFIDSQIIVAALASGALVAGESWALVWLSSASLIQDSVSMILMGVAAILLYILIVAAPSVVIGLSRRTWKVVIYLVPWQILWIILGLVLFSTSLIGSGSRDGIAPVGL
jgi:hypothetical protein